MASDDKPADHEVSDVFKDHPKPCPDGCGDLVREINKPASTETILVDALPAGKVLVAKWWDNENLPTTGVVRTAVTLHECDDGQD